jgi:4-diphosphocytidyl-2-C-methyl-D-erythritol kinase
MARALDAQAKVNLHLSVRGRRPDGYHEIVTVLHALELCDTLVIEPQARGIDLEVVDGVGRGLPVPADDDNLVCRAARAFLAAAAIDSGLRCHLTKRIPAGAGLGGGSSDAAACLRLLDALFGAPLPPAALHALAAGLGADVPYFLAGGTQLATGTGTTLRPLEHVERHDFLLLVPPIGVATAAVYGNLDLSLTSTAGAASIRAVKAAASSRSAMPQGFCNDLEVAAMRLHPELRELRREVVEAGYEDICMSGSGSAFFLRLKAAERPADVIARLDRIASGGVLLIPTRSAAASPTITGEIAFPGGST